MTKKLDRYVVWYNPYNLENGEEDFLVVEAESEDEARKRGRAAGWVTEVNKVDESLDALGWC